jgi:hypothetical protein
MIYVPLRSPAADLLTFRDVSSPRLRDFIFSDGARDVARIYKSEHQKDWTWSVFVIVPAQAGKTHGHELDPKEARRKVEVAWAYAKEHGVEIQTAVATHRKVDTWPATWRGNRTPNGPARGEDRPTGPFLLRPY